MNLRSQAGFSLVAALVAVAITGIVAVGLSQLLRNTFRAQHSVELRSDIASLKSLINDQIDCSKSMPATCPADGFVPLYLSNGRTFIGPHDDKGVKVGVWNFRNRCTAAGLFIEYARYQPGTTDFARNPITNKAENWTPVLQTSAMRLCPRGTDDDGKCLMGCKCKYFTKTWKRGDVPLADAHRREKKYTCPASHPYILAVDEGSACHSLNSQGRAGDLVDGRPTSATCSIQFLADRTDVDVPSLRADCDAKDQDWNQTTCNYTCCTE
jgi:type II secretory pathway pseudopilin PulG